MKFKLDENFDRRLAAQFEADGHDVDTVAAEGLSGSTDDAIFAACRSAGRALVTLDLDFANPFRFPPADTEGVIVVRPPRPVLPAIRATLAGMLRLLKSEPLKGRLWIAEPGRIRVHDPQEAPDAP